jgi:hypothetical protein
MITLGALVTVFLLANGLFVGCDEDDRDPRNAAVATCQQESAANSCDELLADGWSVAQ